MGREVIGFFSDFFRGEIRPFFEAVAVAFIVYDRAVAEESVPMVDNSRSAKVFASFQATLDNAIPTDAPGWIVRKYEDLVAGCGAPAAGPAIDAAPATPAAPAAN